MNNCFDDNGDLISEMIRSSFSDQGFAQVDVEKVTLKAGDTLSVPQPVKLKAEITEGCTIFSSTL
jgi:hypothetical protein